MCCFYKEACTDQDIPRLPPRRAAPRTWHPAQSAQHSLRLTLLLPTAADRSEARIWDFSRPVLRKEADTEKTAQRGLGQLQTGHCGGSHPTPLPGRTRPNAEHHRGLHRSEAQHHRSAALPLPEGTDGPEPHVREGEGMGLAPQRAEGATSVTFAPGKPSTSTPLSPNIYFTDKHTLSSKTDPRQETGNVE